MSRIKIQDLPQDQTISKDELKRIKGGITLSTLQLFPKIEYFHKDLTDSFDKDLTSLGDSTYLKI
ncbi:MAG: hypothetical protein ACYC9O_09740 [Candidatus Latescibacterota bacterium]